MNRDSVFAERENSFDPNPWKEYTSMTKSVLVTLVLIGLSLGIIRVWFVDRPSADPVNIGAENEQTQDAFVDSSVPSRLRDRDLAAASLASSIGPVSQATPTNDFSTPVASASRFVQSTRVKRQDSAFPDEEQLEELAISGLVQDEEGYPLANIEVMADPIHPSEADTLSGDPSLEAARSASTSFDGSFVFENLSNDEYRIRTAPMDGFATAETTARVGELTASLVLIRLRDVQVWGNVNSTEGEQLEDVRVFSGPPTRATDTGLEGDYELDISIKGKNPQTIQFRRKGYRDQTVQLAPADLEDQFDFQLNISMEPLNRLTTVIGRLEDPDGNPVAGKTINMKSTRLRTRYRAQSDVSGNFSMEDVEPGKDYRLTVRPKGDYRDYVRAQMEIPVGGLQHNIVLEPLNQGELSGFITAVNGKPIPGFALTLKSNVAVGRSVQVVSDYVGFFTVERFPEGSAVLKSHSYPIFTTQGIRVSSEPEEPVEVVIDMGSHAIFGGVTTFSGDNVAGADVSLYWRHSQNGVQNYSDRKTTADQNGDFVFTGLGSGVHTLRVKSQGFSMAVITNDVGRGPDNVVVELEEES
jgi:hypothetical protein